MKCKKCGEKLPKDKVAYIKRQVQEVRKAGTDAELVFKVDCLACGAVRSLRVRAAALRLL